MKPIKLDFQCDPIWEFITPIVPASKVVPTWFRDAKSEMVNYGDKTIKACPAILDGFLQVYILPLWADVKVEPTDTFIDGKRVPRFSWSETMEVTVGELSQPTVREQNVVASQDLLLFQESSTSPMSFKFNSPWLVKTPKDYSMLFIPPLNNRDSRFEPVSGVICTDEYITYINVPFIWTAPPDYEGIIKQGTPLVQMIPFKREVFQQKLGFTTDDGGKLFRKEQACHRGVASFLSGGYKRLFHKTAISR